MSSSSSKLIERQRFVVKIFWIILSHVVGFILGIMMSRKSVLDDEYILRITHHEPTLMLSIYLLILGFIFIVMLILFFINRSKSKSSDRIQQIEKLIALKEQGHITVEEFEKEKRKLIDND